MKRAVIRSFARILFFSLILANLDSGRAQTVTGRPPTGDLERAPDDAPANEGSQSPIDLVYIEFLRRSTQNLIKDYHWPSPAEADEILLACKSKTAEESPGSLEAISSLTVGEVLAGHHDLMADFRNHFPNAFLYLRRKLATQYVRAVRQSDVHKRYRTMPTTPSPELFFLSAIKGKSNGGPRLLSEHLFGRLTQEHFLDLYIPGREDSRRTGPYPQPLLFHNGIDELESLARFETPAAFNQFEDRRQIVTEERARRTVAAVESARGFIAVSWSSGKPVSDLWLKTLIEIAERKDFVILVGATERNWEGLPDILLTHPRIHLVTQTIENDTLKISAEAINPDIEDPIPGARRVGRFKPGQTVVLFHPHQRMEIVPTGSNALAPVMIFSTGSVNEPFGLYTTSAQNRRKESAKAFHKLKALVFEKADLESSADPDGSQNLWHPVPLSFYDDLPHGEGAGAIYRGEAFEFRNSDAGGRNLRFSVHREDPVLAFLGDGHTPLTDPFLVRGLLNDLNLAPQTQVILQTGDTFDNGAISHHADDKAVELQLKFQDQDLFLLQHINAGIDFVNAFHMRYPYARFRQLIGNHDEWVNRLLERTPDYQAMINGDFLDELSFIVKNFRWNIWDYIFHRRQKFWESILAENPALRNKILRRVHPILAPDRIDIIERGDYLMIGPPHRKNDVAKHGDRATYGMRRPSLKAHALGMPEGGGIVGDSHRPGIFAEVYDVGTFGPMEPDYGKGFNSAVGQALALLYRNGTKELWIFNRQARSFRQNPGAPVLPAERFFGEQRLRVAQDDNSRVRTGEEVERLTRELECMRRLIGK